MSGIQLRSLFGVAAILGAGAVLAAGVALRPAFAVGGSAKVGPFTVIHCTSNSPCQTYSNQGAGIGVESVNSNAGLGYTALEGDASKGGGDGVVGLATTGNGVMTGSNGQFGVYAQSDSGIGGEFTSTCCTAVDASSSLSVAVQVNENEGGDAVDATNTGGGEAFDAEATADGDNAMEVNNLSSNAVVSYGYFIGSTYGSSNEPIRVSGSNGDQQLFWIDSGGVAHAPAYDVISRTRDAGVAMSFVAQAASPTVEDEGTARLVDGSATVHLDGAFADAIDLSRPYHVILTPDGDTRGLYCASKGPDDFVVRELRGGRSTLAFEYHIYASRAGSAGVRMTETQR